MNRFDLTDEQLNRLLVLIESDNELYNIFKRPITNEEKIQMFIDTYKLGDHDDCILLGGYEYYVDRKQNEKILINDFMPSWRIIYDSIGNKLHVKSYYQEKYDKFTKDLMSINVHYNKKFLDEYDDLLSYNLPVDKINDEEWANKFCEIIKEYKTSFDEEIKLIYGE